MTLLKDFFVKQGVKEAEIENFIRTQFPDGDYSKMELQRTPMGVRIVIHTNRPGRIIGKDGQTINKMTDAIKKMFGIENPQLDVKSIKHPDLDAKIVAKQVASAIEKGFNYKKIANLVMKRVMDAGAVGIELIIAGKITGSKAMTVKLISGYIKQAGQSAKDLVDVGFETAEPPAGTIGVTVKIMTQMSSAFLKKPIAEKKEVI